MSIFGSIMGAIFGKAPAQAPRPTQQSRPVPKAQVQNPQPGPQKSATAPAAAPATSAPVDPVDVEAVLDQLAAKQSQRLDWRHSIVDLMKLLDLDSSLGARKELARELQYSGDTKDSAAMNIWLHKQVMTRLSENGGKVPEDLKH